MFSRSYLFATHVLLDEVCVPRLIARLPAASVLHTSWSNFASTPSVPVAVDEASVVDPF